MPFHFQCFDTFKYKTDSNPVSLSLFLVLLQIKLIKIPFIFTVLGDFIGQIDSNVHLILIVSIVDTFSDQIHSNLISLCLFLILLQIKLIKSPLIFMVLGTFTSQIGAKQTYILILLATFHDQSVSALFRFHCYWYFNWSNWLKLSFIVSAVCTFSDQIDSNPISFSLFSVILLIISIKIPVHFHGSWHF